MPELKMPLVSQAAEAAVRAGVASGGGAALPGMIFNGSKTVSWVDAATGSTHSEPAGRMECTMQVHSLGCPTLHLPITMDDREALLFCRT